MNNIRHISLYFSSIISMIVLQRETLNYRLRSCSEHLTMKFIISKVFITFRSIDVQFGGQKNYFI